jgi:hypothetical protein
MKTTTDQLIAIDVLLEPDQIMVSKANAVNARLRATIPTAMRWTQHMHLISPCCNDSFG